MDQVIVFLLSNPIELRDFDTYNGFWKGGMIGVGKFVEWLILCSHLTLRARYVTFRRVEGPFLAWGLTLTLLLF